MTEAENTQEPTAEPVLEHTPEPEATPEPEPSPEPETAQEAGAGDPTAWPAPPTVEPVTEPVPYTAAATAPTSVVIDSKPPVKKSRSGVVAWTVAAVLGIAAIILGVLWVGASGDADDAKSDRDAVTTELDAANDDLASVQDQLATAQDDLAAALDDASKSKEEIADLRRQVDDLQAQIDEWDANGGKPPISDETALYIGHSFGVDATPPFTDEEATCFGHAMWAALDHESLLRISFALSEDQIGTEHILALGSSIIGAADDCDIARSVEFRTPEQAQRNE